MKVKSYEQLLTKNLDSIKVNKFWSENKKKFSPLHNVHVYPAKFPAFLVDKSLSYAQKSEIEVNNIADIFCGCGTTALESSLAGFGFWGIDSNPVATLITRVKVAKYNDELISSYFDAIIRDFEKRQKKKAPKHCIQNERLKYWFEEEKLHELFHLKSAIEKNVMSKKYRDFFLCAFSNILKKTSRWLQKSIKPTIDKNKKTHPVLSSFVIQVNMMKRALAQTTPSPVTKAKCTVKTGSILRQRPQKPFVDLLLTSPPYVTSYEYADLHQLSSLWLEYAEDFRTLRKESIGSTLGAKTINPDDLNEVGRDIVKKLKARSTRQTRAVSKYFWDMGIAIDKAIKLIRPGGLGIIVIGNTEYNGVKIDNAKFLACELFKNGATNLAIYKREIGTKFLTRFRSKNGRFSQAQNSKEIYHCEFVITFQKPLQSPAQLAS